MSFPRSSGILLHPTSLPGNFGVGDLGDEAYRFVDFLAASKQSLWQVLPLGPTGYGDSPYQCFSAFAGNTLLISPQRLVAEGLLKQEDLQSAPAFTAERVDYGNGIEFKNALLKRAFERFRRTTDARLHSDFKQFSHEASSWLEDYALYRALKDAQGGKAWNEWEQKLARRDATALVNARGSLREQIDAQKFYQFLFFTQWAALKAYCHERGVKLVGDVPIFIARDSADVWMNPDEFKLDKDGKPLVVAGVPPDYFSTTGQLWGNPIYHWERMAADEYSWWIKRFRAAFSMFDMLRVDHFRGFEAYWEVPAGERTAQNGKWVKGPGAELFAVLEAKLECLPILAENLGVITPEVEAIRERFGFPGMAILQFAFGNDPQGPSFRPHNYPRNLVAYTGTHDNDTVIGWWTSKPGEGSIRTEEDIRKERQFTRTYLGYDDTGISEPINWVFIRSLMASVADTVVFPLQDLLGEGAQARMNVPGTATGNWRWRFRGERLTEDIASRLRKIASIYDRLS